MEKGCYQCRAPHGAIAGVPAPRRLDDPLLLFRGFDHLLLAEPVQHYGAHEAGVPGELQAVGAQIFGCALVGGGVVADGQRVVEGRVDRFVAHDNWRQVAAFEGADQYVVVEGNASGLL
jgi:hypothetical protein